MTPIGKWLVRRRMLRWRQELLRAAAAWGMTSDQTRELLSRAGFGVEP